MFNKPSKNKVQVHRPKIIDYDPWLGPYKKDISLRIKTYQKVRDRLLGKDKSLTDFANGHHYFGFHQTQDGWYYREWAPAAQALFLIGDFNDWNGHTHPLTNKENGVWEIFLPGKDALSHQSKVKVRVQHQGQLRDRIPLYIKRVIQDPDTKDFSGQIWLPDTPYKWKDKNFRIHPQKQPFIYEVHIGMAQEEERIGTYMEFAEKILPRVKDLGYNTIQIMAVMEHPYYGSFGYHVSNFFAVSSWFGSPEDFKSLIDKAHQMGIAVLMDIVHSHAVKNTAEGINGFDGTRSQFFHEGEKGLHPAWDSMLFNYSKDGVLHFLLSNIKFWMEEYHFDGFRFDGVTSMIFKDHGLGTAFDSYDKYFSSNTDLEAIAFLQLANTLIKEINPYAITIAEDMSGMPGMCLPIEDGGIGFDYRLAMGIPDFWVKTLEFKDEDWDMRSLCYELTTSRPREKRIAYVESHDQALVGDKTLIFRLADKEMYWHMNKESNNIIIDRAIALHKMIRWITISLGSEGYLNFMGNEFGHPEWIDFPREGNNWSFSHCQRKWSLADNPLLRYNDLQRFDREMICFFKKNDLMGGESLRELWVNNGEKLFIFRKKDFIFIFNFHPDKSYEGFELPLYEEGRYQVVMDTDQVCFGGFGRIDHEIIYQSIELPIKEDRGIVIYIPSRTGMVLKKM